MRRATTGSLIAFCFALLGIAAGAAPAAAEDAASIKALLKKYSPDASFVVGEYSKRNVEYGLPDIMGYWDASSEAARWRSYITIVRESAIYTMSLDRGEDEMPVVLSKDKTLPVPWTSVPYSIFPYDSVPDRMHGPLYGLITGNTGVLIPMQWGNVYGLLQAMAGFYLGAKAAWELKPTLEAQGAKAPWGACFQAIDEALAACLELQYWIFKNALYFKEGYPQYYAGIAGNKAFAEAFIAVDSAFGRFAKDYFEKRETILESLRTSGQTARMDGDEFVIGARGSEKRWPSSKASYSLFAAELAKRAYRDYAAILSGGAAVAPPPLYPGVQAAAAQALQASSIPLIPEKEALALGGLNTGFGKRSDVVRTQQLRALRAAILAKAAAQAAAASAAPPAAGPGGADSEEDQPGDASEESAELQDELETAALAAIADLRSGRSGGSAKPRLSPSAEDELGDVEFGFIDIARADLRVFADMLVCGVSFAESPEKLAFNARSLPADTMEYDWSFMIDLDGDGTDDYSLSLTAFKGRGAKPMTGNPAEVCQSGLWKLEGSSASQVEAEAWIESSGSALFFALADSAELPLKKIGPRSRFSVTSYYDPGPGGVMDSLGF